MFGVFICYPFVNKTWKNSSRVKTKLQICSKGNLLYSVCFHKGQYWNVGFCFLFCIDVHVTFHPSSLQHMVAWLATLSKEKNRFVTVANLVVMIQALVQKERKWAKSQEVVVRCTCWMIFVLSTLRKLR